MTTGRTMIILFFMPDDGGLFQVERRKITRKITKPNSNLPQLLYNLIANG